MVLSLIAIQAQLAFQVWLFAEPEVRLTGARWLAEQTSSFASEIFSQPVADREAKAKQLSSLLSVRWSRERPESDSSGDSIFGRLSATIKATLGNSVRAVEVFDSGFAVEAPFQSLKTKVIPASVGASLSSWPLTSNEPESLVPASLRIAVQGIDRSWISVSFAKPAVGGFNLVLPLLPLIGGGLIIVVISTLTARRIVAPLDRLVEAADQIGKTRDFVPVSDQGLHEFGVVARAFEEMQRRLLLFVKERTQMLAAISHDLRTSLTRMRISAEQFDTDDDRNAIMSEIDDMTAMVDTTLAFASGETSEGTTQPLDLAALLISLVDEAADKGNDCSYVGPDHLEIAGRLIPLKRAFRNLIDNAVKYGSIARVGLKENSGQIEISVSDNGPGIPDDRIEEALAPFRRLDHARSAETPGTGLGLTIVRDVILSHGGSISFKTQGDLGFTATVLLHK